MTSPPVATSATDRTEVCRRNWAGEPGLILGEDRQGYDELLAQVSRALAPRNVMEDVWIRDVVDLVWDIFRLRRIKANLLRVRARNAIREVISPLVRDSWDLADKWSARDANAVSLVEAALKRAAMSMDTVMAATLREEIDHVAQIEAMIAHAEVRRGAALREIERYRANLAENLRRAIAHVDNSDPHAADIVPQSPAEQEAV
ncbi:MAG: hypothetical protein WAV78_27980 [Xanthobacteraceae bacterium]